MKYLRRAIINLLLNAVGGCAMVLLGNTILGLFGHPPIFSWANVVGWSMGSLALHLGYDYLRSQRAREIVKVN